MIYQLIRRDLAWKGLRWLAPMTAAAWICTPPISRLGVLIAIMGVFGGAPHKRAGRFEAALPIEARDLFLARALSLMALVWIPALSAAAAIVILKGPSVAAAGPLAVGALCTLMAAVAQTICRKQIAGPNWTLLPLIMLFAAGGSVMVDRPTPLVPLLCSAVGVALLVWDLAKVPRSFQLASARLKGSDAASDMDRPAAPSAFHRAPVLRSIGSWQYVFFVIMMGFQTFSGQWFLTSFWLFIAWFGMRKKTRWLWALPIGRRGLLWTMIGPMLAAHVLGYCARVRIHRHGVPVTEPRVVVITLAAIVGWVMLTILCCVLVDWRGFARIPRRTLSIYSYAVLAVWFFGSYGALFFAPHSDTWAQDALTHLGRTAPLGLPWLIAAAAVVLMALYWALEKVFSQPDFADKPSVQQGELA